MKKKRHYDSGPYSGVDSRRRMEHEDSMMISEDHKAVANMPQEVMMKPWPGSYADGPEGLDDTIRGIDDQIKTDTREMHKFRSKSKY